MILDETVELVVNRTSLLSLKVKITGDGASSISILVTGKRIPKALRFLFYFMMVISFSEGQIPSKELTYPTWKKENHLQKYLGRGDVLVLRRVAGDHAFEVSDEL